MPRVPARRWRAPLAVGLVALAARLVALAEVRGRPYYAHLVLDASTYQRIATGGDPAEPFYHPPGYPWFLRGLYALTGPEPDAARLAQVVLGAITAGLVVVLARRLGAGERAAVAGGLLAAFEGALVYFDLDLLPASVATLVLTGVIVSLAAPARPAARAATGLALGLGGLVLPTLAIPGGLFALGLFRREGWRPALAFALAAALPVLPITARNLRYEADLVPLSWNGGVNLWIGNNPDFPETMNTRPGPRWEQLAQRPLCLGGARSRAALSRWFDGEVARYALAEPGSFASNLVAKAAAAISVREIGRNRELYEARDESRILAVLIQPRGLPFGLLLPLAGAGAVGLARGRRFPVLAGVAGVLVVGVIFFPTARYRAPALPAMAALAAVALSRPPRREAWMAGAALLAVGLVPPRVPRIPSSATPYAVGTDLAWDGHVEEAIPWLLEAARREPADLDAILALGFAYGRLGRPDLARPWFARATALDPGADLAWQGLGSAFRLAGRPAEAARLFARAVAANPCNPKARALLAWTATDLGHLDAAEALLADAAGWHSDPSRADLADAARHLAAARRGAAGARSRRYDGGR